MYWTQCHRWFSGSHSTLRHKKPTIKKNSQHHEKCLTEDISRDGPLCGSPIKGYPRRHQRPPAMGTVPWVLRGPTPTPLHREHIPIAPWCWQLPDDPQHWHPRHPVGFQLLLEVLTALRVIKNLHIKHLCQYLTCKIFVLFKATLLHLKELGKILENLEPILDIHIVGSGQDIKYTKRQIHIFSNEHGDHVLCSSPNYGHGGQNQQIVSISTSTATDQASTI